MERDAGEEDKSLALRAKRVTRMSHWKLAVKDSTTLSPAHSSAWEEVERGEGLTTQLQGAPSTSAKLSYLSQLLWRRKWQPTPEFLPRESHGLRSLVGYSPKVAKSLTRLSDHVCRVRGTPLGVKLRRWETGLRGQGTPQGVRTGKKGVGGVWVVPV